MHNKEVDHSFLGVGWSFPVRFDTENKTVEMVGGIEDIRESLQLLFQTLPGERRTLLGFGCRMRQLLFDPVNSQYPALIEEAVLSAIESYEPRVEVVQVLQYPDPEQAGTVIVEVVYSVKMTNSRYNLVYPFADLEAIV